MKIIRLRMMVLAFAVVAISSLGTGRASAAVNLSIQVGVPPPPIIVEHPWARPYATAVWIPGHHEWVGGAWVWVGGYYTYPPRPGVRWVRPYWHHGYYYPGHWTN